MHHHKPRQNINIVIPPVYGMQIISHTLIEHQKLTHLNLENHKREIQHKIQKQDKLVNYQPMDYLFLSFKSL